MCSSARGAARDPRPCPNVIGADLKEPRDGTSAVRRNPADFGEPVSCFPEADASDLERAVTAAQDAQSHWAAMPLHTRAHAIREAAARLVASRERLANEVTLEEGKTLAEARAEVDTAAASLRYVAALASLPHGEVIPSARAEMSVWTVREPLGVVGVLTPWNFPVAIPAIKLGAALAAGNAVIFKPSPYTPFVAWRVVEAFLEAGVPSGVLNFLTDSTGDMGKLLVDHRAVQGVSFTGSTQTGRSIAAATARRLVPCQLELSGKNALIVLDDADLDLAASLACFGAFSGTGQKCTATSRVILTRSVIEPFLDRLVACVAEIRVGPGLDPDTTMGPVAAEERLIRVLGDVAQAEAEGANIRVGGGRLAGRGYEGGFFMAPTVLTGVRPDHAIAREEVFGPVLVVLCVENEKQALQVANDSRLGLASAVCTGDSQRAFRFSRDLHAGLVNINRATLSMEYQVPAAGWADSGFGVPEFGPSTLSFYSVRKTVYWHHRGAT